MCSMLMFKCFSKRVAQSSLCSMQHSYRWLVYFESHTIFQVMLFRRHCTHNVVSQSQSATNTKKRSNNKTFSIKLIFPSRLKKFIVLCSFNLFIYINVFPCTQTLAVQWETRTLLAMMDLWVNKFLVQNVQRDNVSKRHSSFFHFKVHLLQSMT